MDVERFRCYYECRLHRFWWNFKYHGHRICWQPIPKTIRSWPKIQKYFLVCSSRHVINFSYLSQLMIIISYVQPISSNSLYRIAYTKFYILVSVRVLITRKETALVQQWQPTSVSSTRFNDISVASHWKKLENLSSFPFQFKSPSQCCQFLLDLPPTHISNIATHGPMAGSVNVIRSFHICLFTYLELLHQASLVSIWAQSLALPYQPVLVLSTLVQLL